jgi:hypothetical protein
MAIVCNTYLSTREFSYSAKTKCFVAEASDFGSKRYFGRVYDDACDEGFVLVSAKTGDSVVLALDSVDQDGDGYVAGWRYKVVAEQTNRGWRNASRDFTVLIIND